MSLMKDLAPTIVSAAVGIMAGYTSVASADAAPQTADYTNQLSQEDIEVANDMHAFIKQCVLMEQNLRSIIKQVCAMPTAELATLVPADEFAEIEANVEEIREVEVELKESEVPDQLLSLHNDVRRAVAKVRSCMVLLQDVTRQAMTVPEVVSGTADPEGIRALAQHTTKRLIELAKA